MGVPINSHHSLVYVGGTTGKAVISIPQSVFGCQKSDSTKFWIFKSVGASISADN